MGPKRIMGSRLDLSGSRDVIDHVIIPFAICHFLLVVRTPFEPSLLSASVFDIGLATIAKFPPWAGPLNADMQNAGVATFPKSNVFANN